MVRRQTEPLRHTCPDIDRLISTITMVIREMEYLQRNTTDNDLADELCNWQSELSAIGEGRYCELESLRASNGALREWGTEMYNEAEGLESERDEFEQKYEETKNENESLKSEIEDLKYELKEQSA